MDTRDVSFVAATLSLLANGATLVLVIGLVGGRRLPTLDRIVWWSRDRALALGALVAIVSALGSLYYSEIADFVPCRYCWFQRVAMYPIVVVLGVAAWRRDDLARLTAGILASVGLAISTWHWLIQHNPGWSSESSCSITAPCTTAYVEEFGFVTIPWMAGSAFALVIVLMLAGAVLREPAPEVPVPPEEVLVP